MQVVMVKGMKLPRTCAVCPFRRDVFGWSVCWTGDVGRRIYEQDLPEAEEEERRARWCPLRVALIMNEDGNNG
jgi:hypothetical protein